MRKPRPQLHRLTRSEIKHQLDALTSWRGEIAVEPIALYVAGSDKPLSDAERRELIARVRAGEVIELELEAVPFIQRETANRNAVRFKNGMLASFAKSFRGVPFLRNHDQDDQAQRGGTVLSSKLERNDDGSTQFRMRLRLVKPWAVESALDGTLDRFSIGWHRDRTKALECSSCDADWLECAHWPGTLDEKGNVVQLVISAADGTEVSAVNVPAVVGTFVESISQLKAIDPAQLADILAADAIPGEHDDMKLLAAVIAALSLPTTTTEDEAAAAVQRTADELSSTKDQLTIAQSAKKTADEQLASIQAQAKQAATLARVQTVETGIQSLLAAGKLKPGSPVEGALRRLGGVVPKLGADGKQQLADGKPVFEVDMSKSIDVFTAHVDEMLVSGASVTPVGAQLPASKPDPQPGVLSDGKAYLATKPETAKWLAAAGIDAEKFEKHGMTGREIATVVFGQ